MKTQRTSIRDIIAICKEARIIANGNIEMEKYHLLEKAQLPAITLENMMAAIQTVKERRKTKK